MVCTSKVWDGKLQIVQTLFKNYTVILNTAAVWLKIRYKEYYLPLVVL